MKKLFSLCGVIKKPWQIGQLTIVAIHWCKLWIINVFFWSNSGVICSHPTTIKHENAHVFTHTQINAFLLFIEFSIIDPSQKRQCNSFWKVGCCACTKNISLDWLVHAPYASLHLSMHHAHTYAPKLSQKTCKVVYYFLREMHKGACWESPSS